jgi:hypothetical protein
MPPIGTIEELRKAIGLGTVHILNIAKGGIAYVGLEFGCEWDSEHGMGVMLHRDRILEIGQADSSFNGHLARKDGGEHLRRGKR